MSASAEIPAGLNSIAIITPALHDVFIAHAFLVILLPLSIALWVFSTKYSRRQAVFILNAISILLAIAVGIMIDWRSYHLIVTPEETYPLSFNLGISVLGVVQALLVDTILLLRLISVYPKDVLGLPRFLALITLPIVLKLARFINLILIIKMLADGASLPNAAEVLQVKFATAPYIKIEWFAQLFDVIYASGFFLYKIWLYRRERRSGVKTGDSYSSFSRRLRDIFWIACTNFVIPALFSLVQIIVVYSAANPATLNDIVLINTNLAVVGVVFASIWAGSYARSNSSEGPSSNISPATGPAFSIGTPGDGSSGGMRFAARSKFDNNTSGTVMSTSHPHSEVQVHSVGDGGASMYMTALSMNGGEIDMAEDRRRNGSSDLEKGEAM